MTIGLAHLNCRELVELVTAYLEGDLSSGERKRFDAQNLKTFGPFYYPPIIKSVKK